MVPAQAKFELPLIEEDYERQVESYDQGSLAIVELQMFELKVKQGRSRLATANADSTVAGANLEHTKTYAPLDSTITAVPLVGQRVNIVTGLPVLIRMMAE